MAAQRMPTHWGTKLALAVARARQEGTVNDPRRYILTYYGGPHDGSDVLGGSIGYDNPYACTYGSPLPGHKSTGQLDVGESTLLRFSLSGQKPTVYRLVRVT